MKWNASQQEVGGGEVNLCHWCRKWCDRRKDDRRGVLICLLNKHAPLVINLGWNGVSKARLWSEATDRMALISTPDFGICVDLAFLLSYVFVWNHLFLWYPVIAILVKKFENSKKKYSFLYVRCMFRWSRNGQIVNEGCEWSQI